jgi:hypothetical protein
VFDASQGTALEITLTGDVTASTFINATAGQTVEIILCQDATGGHAFAAPVNVQWSPVGNTNPSSCAAESFVYDGTTAYYLGPVAYNVGGPITNLNGTGLALALNGGSALPVPSAASSYQFPARLYSGQSFLASVASQPSAALCSFPAANGIISGANASVSLSCITGPGAPTNVTAGNPNIAPGQALIAWSPPSNTGGSPITAYTIRDNAGGTFTASGTAVSTVVTEPFANQPCALLSPPQGCPPINYTFTVTATNGYGTGTTSSASNVIGTPDPVQNFQLSVPPYCGTQVCGVGATWTLPTNTGGAPIKYLGYYVAPSTGCAGGYYYLPATATSWSGCTYGGTFHVWIVNSFGVASSST